MAILYTIFLAIMLSVTTGFGVAAFYPQPERPQNIPYLPKTIIPQSCYQTTQISQTPECQKLFDQDKVFIASDQETQKQYQVALEKYQNVNAGYNRTAVFFGVSIGAAFAIIGLLIIKKSRLVANGLILAGVLTAIATRFLVGFASLGASVTGTSGGGSMAFVEFGILAVLSVGVVMVGLYTLKDLPAQIH